MAPAKSYGEAIQVRFGDILIPRVEMTEPLRLECKHFVECVRDRATPISDAQDGLRVIRIIDAAQRSMEQDGVPVAIEERNDKLRSPISTDRRWFATRV
ncbi:MAG TPA: Gfo/Idh/MocA family oxidoreductase, partial [Candidatus Angelobacter sp.]